MFYTPQYSLLRAETYSIYITSTLTGTTGYPKFCVLDTTSPRLCFSPSECLARTPSFYHLIYSTYLSPACITILRSFSYSARSSNFK